MKNRSFCRTELGIRPFTVLSLALMASFEIACSGGGAGSGTGGASGGGTGGSNPGGAAPFKPCAADMKLGAFTLELKHGDATGAGAYSQATGGVRDGVRPDTVWVPQAVSGAGSECKLMVGPADSCPTSCNATQVCKGNTCITAPAPKSIGEVSFSGLLIPVVMTPMKTGTNVLYTALIPSNTAYPPYTVGAALGLTAAGEDYPGFTLAGVGIQPLEAVAGQTLNVDKNQALTIKWVAPPSAGAGRIRLNMDIAHHGGVAAEIHCDLPDTGTVTIPAPLITALIDKGAFGFPMVSLARLSTDSKTVGPGCLEFNVAASIDLALNVAGVVSCTEDKECTAPQICLSPGYKCGMP
jgi:hypothetical protein